MKFFWISIFILPCWTINCNIENCIQCSSTSPNICLQCQPSYSLSRTTCTYSESNYLDQVSNCDIRTEDSKCERCRENYHIYKGFCQADCDEGCSCYEPNICEENFVNEKLDQIKQALTQCPPGCVSCSFSDYCYKCDESYTLYSGQCFWCPDTNCEECYSDGYCNVCAPSYFVNSGFCITCPSHCKRCDGWLSCKSCTSGYKVKDGLCDDDDDDDDDGTKIAAGIIVLIVILSIAGVSAVIIGIIIYRKRRMNRLAGQQQMIISQQPAAYLAHPMPNQPSGYSPPAQSNLVMGSIRVVQLDGRNMVMGQGNCSFCGQSLRMEVETILLPCNHALHGYCVQNMINSRGFRACSVCNMQFS